MRNKLKPERVFYFARGVDAALEHVPKAASGALISNVDASGKIAIKKTKARPDITSGMNPIVCR
jgi:hypothetical protein